MFDADRPITSSDQDRLGRSTFAKYLARCILDHKNPESLVIGLYGGLGVGKTSVINLTLQELRYAASNMLDEDKPVILNFSPWSYSGQNQLIFSFFRRLSSELRRAEYLENSEKIIHLLELYISFFTHQPVPKSLRPKHNIFTRFFKRKTVTEETYGWESGRDLTQVKAELNELLSKQKHKIIMIIDNIPRLEDAEIRQIFQIVKSMGDYANTVYLLALDKEQMLRVISRIHNGNSESYLNKIIQLPFDIPPISPQDLENIFVDRLKKLMAIVPEDSWSQNYWADLYYSTIKFFFRNVRDITHYINTLGFSYIHVKEVVNPVDFFAITALEVFEPEVYAGIRANKDLFTDLMDTVYEQDPEKIAEDKLRCDEIIARSKQIPADMLLPMLIRLFPRLRTLYNAKMTFYHSEAVARKNLRICAPDVFDIYFRMSMPVGLIPEAEFYAILSMIKDEQGFALALLRLNQDDKILKFLDLFDSTGAAMVPSEHINHVVDALIDSGDLFPEGETSLVSFNTPMRIHRILHQLLRRFDLSEKRFDIFRNAIKKSTNSIYSIVHELNVQAQEHSETEDTFLPLEHRDFNPEQLTALQKLAVGKIMYWAENGRLVEHPKLIDLLYAWKNWGNEEECRQYVAEITKQDKKLLYFLQSAFKEPIDQAITKLEKNPEWNKYIINVEAFISPQAIEPLAKLMFEDISFEKMREREQLALLIFLDSINANTTKVIPKTSI